MEVSFCNARAICLQRRPPWRHGRTRFGSPQHPKKTNNPQLSGDLHTDVAILGAGFTGLRAALALAEAGTSVVMLDAGDVGWGASGRTGGQVNPMLPFNSPEGLRRILGQTYFERLTETSLNSADELFH